MAVEKYPGLAPGTIHITPLWGSCFHIFQTLCFNSAPSGLVKIVRSIQGATPLATYFAPSGLESASRRTSSVKRRTNSVSLPINSARAGQVDFILYPLSFIILNPSKAGQVLKSARRRTGSGILYPCLQPQRGGIASKGCSPLKRTGPRALSPERAG
jgi:hypothetical protein